MTAKKKSEKSKSTPPRSVSNVSTDSETSGSLAMLQLTSPDGYYTYLGIEKQEEIDEESVKKNYRRLSLKHHPDRRGGDAATFRLLKRAQVVLLNKKLRQQYDLIGLDLEDDEHTSGEEKEDDDEKTEPPVPETLVAHMATTSLAAIMQLAVRTVMMGAASVFLCRWRWTLFPVLAFLLFICFKIASAARVAAKTQSGAEYSDMISPLAIGLGMVMMYKGRDFPQVTWTFLFWFGESLVMALFSYNSIPPSIKNPVAFAVIAIVSLAISAWLRGSFWRYVTILGLEAFLAVVAAMAFPLMELLLEEIVKAKLQKVGEKVRAHDAQMRQYYEGTKETKS